MIDCTFRMIPPIRPITEDEKPQAEALYRNAYKITTERSQHWTMLADLSTTRAIVDEDRVLSILTIKPFEVWIGGRLMKMGGISGVATWADQQGKGYAGHLVKRAIADMHDAGQYISILYPFSFQFYGRFGYELANEYITYSAAPADFTPGAANDDVRVRAANLEVDLPAIKECYATAAPRWNTMVNRTEERWNQWKEYFQGDLKQVYVLETLANKKIIGQFGVMETSLPDGGYESTVTGLVFQDESYAPIVGRFLHRLPKNVKSVKLIGGSAPRLWHLFKEPSVTSTIHSGYQARVVDVEMACRERGYDSGVNAEACFVVQDGCASAWNEHPWRLTVRDGQPEIKRDLAIPQPPLVLSIQEFSAIFVGYRRATELAHSHPDHIKDLEALDQIFFDRPTRLLDFF